MTQQPKVVYQHIRRGKASWEADDEESTTAMELNDKREVVAYAVARCNPKDQFSKHQGRAKAGGRLNSPRYRMLLMPPVPLKEFMEHTYHWYQ